MVTPLRPGTPQIPTERPLRLPEGTKVPVQGRADLRPEPGQAIRTPAPGLSPATAGQDGRAAAPDPAAPVRLARPGSLVDIRI
ncbi:MAG: hypothetical protein WCJ52_08185 [Phenylobacterium sp.]|uniref:hypothetical protein n=1 Tax=Phenylobacterium sp. TaxID=1871053 RepID=UPI003015EE96